MAADLSGRTHSPMTVGELARLMADLPPESVVQINDRAGRVFPIRRINIETYSTGQRFCLRLDAYLIDGED